MSIVTAHFGTVGICIFNVVIGGRKCIFKCLELGILATPVVGLEFNLVTVALGSYNSDAGVGCKSLGNGELIFVGEGLVFAFATTMFRAFYIGTTQTKTLTMNSIVMVASNIFFNWILIFGKFGLPALGITGAAIGSSLAELVSLLFFIIYIIYFIIFNLTVVTTHKHLFGTTRFISYQTKVESFLKHW